ncbi:unnamed protein product, partial [Dicrocoelium dendriticum]
AHSQPPLSALLCNVRANMCTDDKSEAENWSVHYWNCRRLLSATQLVPWNVVENAG